MKSPREFLMSDEEIDRQVILLGGKVLLKPRVENSNYKLVREVLPNEITDTENENEKIHAIIPNRYCRFKEKDCKFFMWTGNMEEDYCGLYMKFTGTDNQYPSKKKPDFCEAKKVWIK